MSLNSRGEVTLKIGNESTKITFQITDIDKKRHEGISINFNTEEVIKLIEKLKTQCL